MIGVTEGTGKRRYPMARRKIVTIDEDKCTGCGQCVHACAEAAIEIVDGKAKLIGEVYCDGIGACLGSCPEDAITIEEREADAFDEKAVAERIRKLNAPAGGCPSVALKDLGHGQHAACPSAAVSEPKGSGDFSLRSWPIQLTLVPPAAPFLQGADIVLVADCTAFARPSLLSEMASGKPVLIACPKLDDASAYVEKLTELFQEARPRTLTIVHMSVPCCHGLTHIARQALDRSEAEVPVTEVTVGVEGEIAATETWAAKTSSEKASAGRT